MIQAFIHLKAKQDNMNKKQVIIAQKMRLLHFLGSTLLYLKNFKKCLTFLCTWHSYRSRELMICTTLILWFRVYSRSAAAIAKAGTSLLSAWRTPLKTVGRPIEINACQINGQLKKKREKKTHYVMDYQNKI